MDKFTIVIPVYNEAKNLVILIPKIYRELRNMKFEHRKSEMRHFEKDENLWHCCYPRPTANVGTALKMSNASGIFEKFTDPGNFMEFSVISTKFCENIRRKMSELSDKSIFF